MNLTDELSKLAELHHAGALSDAEFAAAKRRLIAGPGAEPTTDEYPAEAAPPGEPAAERTFWSSRWSSGNLFFPDSLTLAPDGLRFRKRRWLGSREERINYRAIASVRVTHGVFLATLSIETSGGSQPIFINGLWRSAARAVEDAIRARQRQYRPAL